MEVQTTKTVRREALSEHEKDFLRENYLYLTDEAIADVLGLSGAVTARKIRSNLKLRRNRKSTQSFIKEIPMIIWLQRELYDSTSFENLVRISI